MDKNTDKPADRSVDAAPVEPAEDTKPAPEVVVTTPVESEAESAAANGETVEFGQPANTIVVDAKTVERLMPALKTVVIVLVFTVVGVSAWHIIKRVGVKPVTSYQTCVAAGGAVQESYPPVCIDQKTGKHYNAFTSKPTADLD